MPTSESIKHAITSCISHSLRQQFSKAATMIRCIGVIVATLLIARDISGWFKNLYYANMF